MKFTVGSELAMRFYDENYDVVFSRMWDCSEKILLGDKSNRSCRFCGKCFPEVSFKKIAHAIPEALGNRGLTSVYECDSCNDYFGRTIESDLGEWSKPMRTFSRIRGKKGVPKIKKSGTDRGWRIEYGENKINVKCHEDDPIVEVNEESRTVKFNVPRGPYCPVAVYKSFVKIALSLMPDSELKPFQATLNWIRDEDHSNVRMHQLFVKTDEHGPSRSEKMFAHLLRRKGDIKDLPYFFLILAVGNSVFQVMIPSSEMDASLGGSSLSLRPFPTTGGPDPELYGRANPVMVDMSEPGPVNDYANLTLKFESLASLSDD